MQGQQNKYQILNGQSVFTASKEARFCQLKYDKMYCIPWAVVMNSNLHNLDISSSCHSIRFRNIFWFCYDHWWLPSSAWELQNALFEILWDPVEFLKTVVKHSYMVIPFQNVFLGHGKEHLFNKGKLAGELLTRSSGLVQNLRY